MTVSTDDSHLKELVTSSLATLKDLVNNEKYEIAWKAKTEFADRYYVGSLSDDETATNLRLDWEFRTESIGDNQNTIGDLIISQTVDDIVDLLINGDISNSSDVLLKCIDGEVVRNKKVDNFSLISTFVKKQDCPKKNSVEYTVFMTIYAKFK